MSLFTPDEMRELIAEFPDKPVKTVCQQIERKAKSMTISSPMGLAKSWLRKAKSIADDTTQNTSLPVRGTFGPGGEWLSGVTMASEWESRLIHAAREIRSQFLSPAEAVHLLRDRGLADMVRDGTMAVWARLEHVEHWPCAHTSTSAEQWLKTYVVGA